MSHIIPFPKRSDSTSAQDFGLGKQVLALYPGTTALYRATVAQQRKVRNRFIHVCYIQVVVLSFCIKFSSFLNKLLVFELPMYLNLGVQIRNWLSAFCMSFQWYPLFCKFPEEDRWVSSFPFVSIWIGMCFYFHAAFGPSRNAIWRDYIHLK